MAFEAEEQPSGVNTIFVLTTAGDDPKAIMPGTQASQPDWSPDGDWIAYDNGGKQPPTGGHVHLFAVRPDGTGRHRLTAGNGDQGAPSWDPTGRRIVFDGNWPDRSAAGFHSGLGIVNIATGQMHEITRSPHRCDACFDAAPAWSPDGETVSFSRTLGDDGIALFTVKPDGSHLHRLTSYALRAGNPAWSPRQPHHRVQQQ